ncbi:tRNA (adenine(22)-N(1))-methyltransferase [Thalassobacillus pellis]|uniref:tRNA (adenine(22)-N(1))-methyltransferase n=1 Tax=Thalassobacillus pellis TaxID=748008 RepID=UPI00196039F9|nr:tRNA (adenine(22)-N(1))-methyltransferase TrmK [Thalassobacillus pellis]MBM7554743.1 tRNA (adenine22-N1)-methyltransferase [Thalassobacillus pellis]
MNEQVLSLRLQVVADQLPAGANFADIGSDHAYLPCYVCLNDSDAKAIAGEVNEGPYQSALREVKEHNLEGRISVRKGDGLSVVKPGEAEQVVIAGMGGTLIAEILEKGIEVLDYTDRVIAQPNVDAKSVRKWLIANGFQITGEKIVEEGGHIYEIVIADRSEGYHNDTFSERELYFGPFLLKEKSDIFRKKWEEENQKLKYVFSQMRKASKPDNQKLDRIQKEIKWIEEVLENG